MQRGDDHDRTSLPTTLHERLRTDDPDTEDARVNDWVNVVRRAQLGPTVKLAALIIASYANPDGSKVFPGIARLAVQCGIDYRTAQRALSTLRNVGLIRLVRRGARRNGLADEYRLTLAEDLLDRCDVPSPAAERAAIQKVTDRHRHRSTRHPCPVEATDNHTTPVSCESGSTRHGSAVLHDTGDAPPKRDPVLQEQPPSEAGNARRNATSVSGPEAERRRQMDGLAAMMNESAP